MELLELCRNASSVKYILQRLTEDKKINVLKACADALVARKDEIIKENQKDITAAKEKNMPAGLVDRLYLSDNRIYAMAEGIRQVAALQDPVGEVMEEFTRPNGLQIRKCRVPIGVIGIIYEARPNVTADAFALCFKSGNVVILKGGSDALYSNRIIVQILRDTLLENNLPEAFLQLIESVDHEITTSFMKMNDYVDLLIPRGSNRLIQSVVKNSTIPVIETGTGNCHIYVDEYADIKKAIPIIINAKTQRVGVCNACESLVIHQAIKEKILPELAKELQERNVEIRGDEETCELIKDCVRATEQDYGMEYLDYIISIKVVSSIEEAIGHINRYNTGHSECVITENKEHAAIFLNEIDAACVYVNASTRFTDGFEFGFGAEIGISTQKMHARGPMGLKELTSYKYKIQGDGQIRE